MIKKQKIHAVFVGTSQFAVPILETLASAPFLTIDYTITSPDMPSGRKHALNPSPVKQFCTKHNLSFKQPLRISELAEQLRKDEPDIVILASYGQIIPRAILTIPKFGCLNLHPSLLPEYRGPSPIQTAILNNDKTTGVSVMLMDEQIDHGPIIGQKKTKISSSETYPTLEQKLSRLAAALLIKILPKYLNAEIKPRAQNHSMATFTRLLKREDGKIDLEQSAKDIERKIRAYYPWPGTWIIHNRKRLKIMKAKIADTNKDGLGLKTKKGFLQLELVQPEGRRIMSGQEYFRGCQK